MVTTIICYTAITVSIVGFSYGIIGIAVSAIKATKNNTKKSLAE